MKPPERRARVPGLSLQLFALLAIVSVAAVGFTAWYIARGLESGFTGYLNTLQSDRLDAIAGAVAAHYRETGTLEGLRAGAWRRILRNADPTSPPPPPQREGPPGQWRPPFDRPPEEGEPPPQGGPGMGPQGPPRDLIALGARLTLLDAQGHIVIGPPPREGDEPAAKRDVMVEGKRVGQLVVLPLPRPVEARDLQFLSVQRRAIGLTAIAAVVLSLLVASVVAGLWTRRIRAVENTAARIASGDLAARVNDNSGDEIGALASNVNAMGASLETLERARRKWLADVAHELRTPLTVLRAEIEALIDGVRPVDAKALRSLHEEVAHLSRLTEDLHLLALSDLKALPLERHDIDLAAVARRVGARWEGPARDAGLALKIEGTGPISLNADEGRITQLCDNLLANSVRYTDRPGEVRIAVEKDRSAVRLIVEDSPPGVPPQGRANLFEPLYRPDAARSRAAGGSGLGLALARAIVEAHGGAIEARDSPLGGLRVIARFPLAPA